MAAPSPFPGNRVPSRPWAASELLCVPGWANPSSPQPHPGCHGSDWRRRTKGYVNLKGSGKPQHISYPLLFIRFPVNSSAVTAAGIGGQETASRLGTFAQRWCRAVGASSQHAALMSLVLSQTPVICRGEEILVAEGSVINRKRCT